VPPADVHPDHPFWADTPDGSVPFADIPVRPGGRLPSFFIIGAAKCATTSLNDHLDQHPEIHMQPLKEPHFFSTDAIYERGIDWYRGLFADAAPGQVCGEASTSYTRYPHTPDVPRRIAEVVPDAKLIYIVRDPVERLVSACLFALKRERYALHQEELSRSMDEHIKQFDVLRNTSEYITQIEQYLRFFDQSQLLVLLQRDLSDRPEEVLRRTFAFLGVDPDAEVDGSRRLNESAGFVEGVKEEKAAELARRIPGYRALKRIVPDPLVQRVKALVARRIPEEEVVVSLSEEYAAELREHYAPFNARLAELIDRDLSHWQ